MTYQSFEGTWEEVLRQVPDLAGQRVKLTILTPKETESQVPQSLANALKGRIGRVCFQPADLSERTSIAFADILEDKHNALACDCCCL